jgi:hypothetical protein
MSSRITAVIVVVAVGATVALLVSLIGGWDQWVFVGVVVATLFGAAVATQPRQYTTKKRTFVKTSKPRR